MKIKILIVMVLFIICVSTVGLLSNSKNIASVEVVGVIPLVEDIDKKVIISEVEVVVVEHIISNIPTVLNEDANVEWTNEDIEMLACVIYQEAGADYISDDTRLKVGNVVMNRVESELYPNTIHEVLMQEKQYGRFYWTGIVWPKRAETPQEEKAVKRAYQIAERVLSGERVLDSSYIFQSEHKQTDDYIFQDGLYFCR